MLGIKKRFVMVACVTMMCGGMLVGCTTKSTTNQVQQSKTIKKDIDNLVKELRDNVEYEKDMAEVGENAIMFFPDMPEDIELELYNVGGYIADELAIARSNDDKDLDEAKKVFEEHIEDYISQFSGYEPREVPKLEKAVISRVEGAVILCVTDDYKTAEDIINGF